MTKNFNKIKALVELSRPFTLLAPTVGFLSGAIIGVQHFPPFISFVGALSAALLNAASNTINQIFDLSIDRVNKPSRPLPQGTLSTGEAWTLATLCYLASWALAYLVGMQFFVIVLFTSFVTYAYSGPPFRTKRWALLANPTIALPRGLLLMVAGWASVKSVFFIEPWFVGLIFGLFILGAATTKDFADMKGDALYGCKTLPIIFGVKKSALIISPFLVFPFLLIPLGVKAGILLGSAVILTYLGFGLALWGCYVAYLILRKPEELTLEANHVSWKHMYLLLMSAQLGFAMAYMV